MTTEANHKHLLEQILAPWDPVKGAPHDAEALKQLREAINRAHRRVWPNGGPTVILRELAKRRALIAEVEKGLAVTEASAKQAAAAHEQRVEHLRAIIDEVKELEAQVKMATEQASGDGGEEVSEEQEAALREAEEKALQEQATRTAKPSDKQEIADARRHPAVPKGAKVNEIRQFLKSCRADGADPTAIAAGIWGAPAGA